MGACMYVCVTYVLYDSLLVTCMLSCGHSHSLSAGSGREPHIVLVENLWQDNTGSMVKLLLHILSQ